MVSIEAQRARLEAWLERTIAGTSEVRLSSLRLPKGTGQSAETIFADVEYRIGQKREKRKLVVRQQAEEEGLFFRTSLMTQYRMMSCLSRHPDVRVPNPIGIEMDPQVLGKPFLVMEHVEGRAVPQVPNFNLEGWVAELSPEDRRRAWLNAIEMLAALHSIDWRDGFQFLNHSNYAEGGLEGYLGHLRQAYRWAKQDRHIAIADAAFEWLHDNQPENVALSVVWGDANPANILFAPDLSVAALTDFEGSELGPGEVDLAWWLMIVESYSAGSGIPQLEGLPSREETIAFYEERLGRRIENLSYFELLAQVRSLIVFIRFSDQIVKDGYMPAGTDVLTHNPMTAGIARTLGWDVPEPGEGFDLMTRGWQARLADRHS